MSSSFSQILQLRIDVCVITAFAVVSTQLIQRKNARCNIFNHQQAQIKNRVANTQFLGVDLVNKKDYYNMEQGIGEDGKSRDSTANLNGEKRMGQATSANKEAPVPFFAPIPLPAASPTPLSI
ncbi:hypothetical protein OIU84_018949 [Salix udensis]|uniref:Uncharacterized protein n=1 Tax=Salix udensis TaxID=889485 RepID=A0AAD6KXW8_9ROSI|nr:hypothetical protein OIU84_018949 [Salix udensis]